jgi:hypothetical protein
MKKQYERKIRLWKLRKNIPSEKWRSIAQGVREREDKHLSTSVEIDGVLIGDEKVKREIARYGFQTTWERQRQIAQQGKFPVLIVQLKVNNPEDTSRGNSGTAFRSFMSFSQDLSRQIKFGSFQLFIGIFRSLEVKQSCLSRFDICELTL